MLAGRSANAHLLEREKVTQLSRGDLISLGAADLADLLLEVSTRDPEVHQRLSELVERGAARKASSAGQPMPREPHLGPPTYMVGNSPIILKVFDSIRRYAASSAPVLIAGESGTGKELVARAVHERSPWRNGPFVAINCGALPTSLIGSELFGYEKGAFTGASSRKIGRIETAENGTIFLDEIGDLPLETQTHLLRFLQEHTIERLGGSKTITVNVRVVAATNVNLREAVVQRRFREDLYYRLNVLTLSLPPLRERGDDLQLLTKFFLEQFSNELGRQPLHLSPAAERAILAYRWPGNVRELIACLRRAVVMADDGPIEAETLGLPINEPVEAPRASPAVSVDRELLRVRAGAEAAVVRSTLERNRFNIKQSAQELQISRVTLYRLIQKHDIEIERPRARRNQLLPATPLAGNGSDLGRA